MKLSVVIPCYNFENYIEECVLSFLEQITDFDFEILIGEDSSIDNSLSIIENIKSEKIRIIKNETNLGFYKNIKNLILESKGEYISYLDGDDYLTDKYKLQKQVDFLDKNPQYVMHSTGCQYIEKDGKSTETYIIPLFEILEIKDLIKTNYVSFGRTFRNIPNLVKDWMENIDFLDWCINFELAKYGKIKCENWPSGNYRITGDGLFTSSSQEEVNRKNIQVSDILNFQYLEYQKKQKNIGYSKKNITLNVHLYLDDKKERIAYDNLKRLKEFGLHITATSAKPLSNRMMELVDVLLYDKENMLLKKDYGEPKTIFYYHDNDSFRFDFGHREKKPHSLAVLRSMIKGCELAKMNNFDFVIRIEFDDILSKESVDWIINQTNNIKESMLLFKNVYNDVEDISVHTMLYKPEEFLRIFANIKSEEDYYNHIINIGINKHLILEEFILIMLKRMNGDVKYIDGKQMSSILTNSLFNLHSSPSSLVGGCLIDLMRCDNGINYFGYICHESPGSKITLKQYKESGEILQNNWDVLPTYWAYLPIDKSVISIEILVDNILVDNILYKRYEFKNGVILNECLSKITFK